jgi:beta-glucosidase
MNKKMMLTKRIVNALLLVTLLAACTLTPAPARPTPTPTQPIPVYKDPAQPVEARVADLLSRMTVDEKIGQMTQVENKSIKPGDITRFFIGSILSGGDGIPADNTLAGWTTMVDGYQREALGTRLAIPMIYGIDAVHGVGHLQGATIFPQNVGLGATHDPALVRRIGQATAEEMLAVGIPWNFAPVVAVPQDIRWGRTYEGYSEDTNLVSELGAAYIEGLQSGSDTVPNAPGKTIAVLATAKHFIGDGGTTWGSSTQGDYKLDQGDTRISEETLRSLFLPAYKSAVDAGALAVMASFSSWNGTKMHGQKYLLTDVLKGELGFKGFIVSDWGGIDAVAPGDYYKSVVTAVNAGVDMNMVPTDYQTFIQVMNKAVTSGDISQARLDDAVTRILRVKFLLGLFDHPFSNPVYRNTVRSTDHLALASQAVRESLVLLKDQNAALPLQRNVSALLVAGAGADSTGFQSGGWTLGWQGSTSGSVTGSSILDGIRSHAGSTTQVLYKSDGNFSSFKGLAPVGVAVVSELPYAEGFGDKADLRLSSTDIAVLNTMRPKVTKLVVIILSGRPLVIADKYQKADAWVAAWLPGSEGAAVADVLFGDHPFVGKTPYSWPRSNSQLPINENNSADSTGCKTPLFPVGYGLGEAGSQPIQFINCP